MKTTKIAFFKKAITAGMMVVLFVVSVAFRTKDKKKIDDKPRYCVVMGWEITNDATTSQPVISNVAYYDCRFYNSMHAENELSSFYKAYYGKNSGTFGLEKMTCFSFETRDAAIKKRRELIAQHNDQWNPLLINDFTITCAE